MCDLECMSGMCNYDRNYAGNSECELWCIFLHCPLSKMGNGHCDPECDWPQCGYDLGDCAYCAFGCIQSELGNGVCSTICDKESCKFDGGDCGFCKDGCFENMLGNGHCDPVCLNAACENDRGDCDSANCAPGCYPYEVADLVCNPECNNAACGFDGGDCYCSPGCSPDLLANDVCDPACATLACGLDGKRCVRATQGDCANGCFASMVGNGVCNQHCFTSECNFDVLDCGCSPGCSTDMYGKCEYPCLVPDCNYDGCWGSTTHIMSYAWQATEKRLDSTYDFVRDCQAIAPKCLIGNLLFVLEAKMCYALCENCLKGYGLCNNKGLAAGCLWGFDNNYGQCILCINKQIYTSCVDRCTHANPDHRVSNKICYPAKDTSTTAAPDTLYVTATATGANAGTANNPYFSLAIAFAQSFMAYTDIHLLAGEHSLTQARKPLPEAMLLASDARPLRNGFSNKRVRVSPLLCTGVADHPQCATGRVTLMVLDLDFTIDVDCEVTFEKVIFDGTKSLKSGSVNPDGFYCPSITINSDGVKLNDHNQVVDTEEYIPQTVCDTYSNTVFISVSRTGSLQLREVDFINLRHQPKALIESAGGSIALSQVNFRNIVVRLTDGAVIRHVSDGGFSYVQGRVSYLNNGYEVTDSLSVGGFLYADGLGDIGISLVSFDKNIAVAAETSTVRGLFSLRQFRTFTLTSCTFHAGIVTHLIYISTGVLQLSQVLDASRVATDYAIEHFHLQSCQFSNNFAFTALIAATYSADLQNFRIEDCTFTDNVAKASGIVELVFSGVMSSEVTTGATKGTASGPGYFAPRHVQIARSTFTGNLGPSLFAVSNFANVAFSDNCQFSANGASDTLTYNDIVFELFIADSDSYLSERHKEKVPSISPCRHILQFKQCAGAVVSSAVFADNYCDAGIAGVVATLSTTGLQLSAVKFLRNRALSPEGSVLSVTDISSPAVLSSAEFSANKNELGAGVVYFGPATTVTVESCSFSGNQAPTASGIWASDALKLAVVNTAFLSNSAAVGSGGAVSFQVNSGAAQYSLEVRACAFTSNRSTQAKGGGVFVYSDKVTRPFSIKITGSTFTSNSALTQGAAIYIDANLALTTDSAVADCKFMKNTSARGTIQLLFASGQLAISSALFSGNFASEGSGIAASTLSAVQVVVSDSRFEGNESAGGVISYTTLDDEKQLATVRCSFSGNSGLAVSLQRTKWKDTQSTFTGTQGAAVTLVDQSDADLTGAKFTSNTSAKSGGAVYLANASAFKCTSCNFSRNSSGDKGGAIYLEQGSVIRLTDCALQANSCKDKGSAVFILGSVNANSAVTGSVFTANSADNSGVVSLLLSVLKVSACIFDSNSAKGATPGIVLNLSTLTVTQTEFRNQKGQIGAFLYVTTESLAAISGSKFTSAFAASGGAFAVISSNFTLSDSTLSGISATAGGGLIAFSESIIILAGVTMSDLAAEDGSIALLDQGSLSVVGSTFSNFAFSGIHADKLLTATVSGSTFSNGRGSNGGAFTCTRCKSVQIDSSTFSNNTATYGGGLYLSTLSDSLVSSVYRVSTTTFFNNTAWLGGGAYTNNVHISFSKCVFQSNHAERPKEQSLWSSGNWGRGGGATGDCGQAPTCALSYEFCKFIGNKAEVSGGGIAWQDVRPTVKNCSYDSNRADYGNDISSFAVSIHMRERQLTSIDGVASGQKSTEPIVIELVDHYGQVVSTDSSSVAELVAVDPVSTVLSGETKVSASNGVFYFDEYIVAAEPKTTAAINVLTTAIDLTKAEKAMDNTTYVSAIEVSMGMRACELGESHVLTTCKVCEAGKYSLDPESLSCSNCPSEAVCYGNYTMVPKSGYWRARYDSTVFYQCFYAPACTGSPEPPANLSLTGNCANGYEGHLCQTCSKGYSRSNKNECAVCPDPATNIVRLIFIGIAIVLVAALMVYTTMRSAYREKSQASIYIKILMNYLQIMTLVASFNLEWVQQAQDLLDAQDSAGAMTEQVFSLDCYLDTGDSTPGESSVYSKLVMMAVLPLFIAVVSLFVWVLIQWARRQKQFPVNGLVATMVILLFLAHPTITKFMFNVFACMDVDGQYYMLQELSVPCWDTKHTFYCLACALPSIVLWVIGVPALCLLYLVRNKRTLGSISARMKLGFLFNGFRAHAFYWEFVILYRKIVIISCSVFLTTISIPVQALCVVVVLLGALYFQDRVNPYTSRSLNDVELRSILCATVTIYCGLYFLTGAMSGSAGLGLFIVMVLANAVFFWHWVRYALASYVAMAIHAIPALRLRFGYFHKVKDGLDEDIFVRNHHLSPFEKHECEGFTPTLSDSRSSLQTMKDVYLLKLRHANVQWSDRDESPLPQYQAEVSNPFTTMMKRLRGADSTEIIVEDIK